MVFFEDGLLPKSCSINSSPWDDISYDNERDLKDLITKIKSLFEELQKIKSYEDKVREKRHDIFKFSNALRVFFKICPNVKYVHRQVYFRQAERVLERTSHIKDEQSLSKLTPLAEDYIKTFGRFQALMKNADISYDDLYSRLSYLSEAHLKFSQTFAPISAEERKKNDPPQVINTPSNYESDLSSLNSIVKNIFELFNQLEMTKTKRDNIFKLIDKLRKKISSGRCAEQIDSEFFLWQAENISCEGCLKDELGNFQLKEERLKQLTPLAESYRKSYRDFKSLITNNKTISFDDLLIKLNALISAHNSFYNAVKSCKPKIPLVGRMRNAMEDMVDVF